MAEKIKTPNEDPGAWHSVEDKPLFRNLTYEEAVEAERTGRLEFEEAPEPGRTYIEGLLPVSHPIMVAVHTNMGWDIDIIDVDEEMSVSALEDDDWDWWGWELEDVDFWRGLEPGEMDGWVPVRNDDTSHVATQQAGETCNP